MERPPLFTIGYGSRSLDRLAESLRGHGVECLVDVRSAPYSRFRPEFSRVNLEPLLGARGLRYVFQGDSLGGRPEDPDCYVDGKVDYDQVRRRAAFQKGLDRLEKALEQGMRVSLLCSEGRPEECHRSKLIGVALAERGIAVAHIDEDGVLVTQEQVIERLTGGQLNLFGESGFTSRKRYGPEERE